MRSSKVNHTPAHRYEEFITVYRLHALVPDLIEYRDLRKDANQIQNKIPVIETFRGKATGVMHSRGLGNWALSMGRQRLGLLALENHPRFLQNVKMGRLESATQQIDVAALGLIRDRERGVPRFNEFRRQYGLRQLSGRSFRVCAPSLNHGPSKRSAKRSPEKSNSLILDM